MLKNRIINGCDKTAFFSICALIYFLPISIALVEWFVALPVLCFCIKKITVFFVKLKDVLSKKDSEGFLCDWKSLLSGENVLILPVVAYAFICFLSIFVSSFPELSTRAFFGKILERVFLFFIMVECLNTPKRIKRFAVIMFISFALITINGFYQCVNTTGFIRGFSLAAADGRITSSFKHPNDFASYLIFPVMVLFNILMTDSFSKEGGKAKYFFRIFFMILFGLSIVNLSLTFSRGAFVGIIGALAFMGAMKYCKRRIVLSSAVVFLLLLTPLMSGMRNVSMISDNTSEGVSVIEKIELGKEDESQVLTLGMGRVGFWKEALESISRKPILGTGINTYSKEAQKRKSWTGYYAHNCYLQMAAEIGFVGLGSFVWILIVLFKCVQERMKCVEDKFLLVLLQGATAGLVGFLVHSFFDTQFYSVQLNTLFWVIVGLIVSISNLNKKSIERET